eukprot:2319727-Amphidinium_carterae.1
MKQYWPRTRCGPEHAGAESNGVRFRMPTAGPDERLGSLMKGNPPKYHAVDSCSQSYINSTRMCFNGD